MADQRTPCAQSGPGRRFPAIISMALRAACGGSGPRPRPTPAEQRGPGEPREQVARRRAWQTVPARIALALTAVSCAPSEALKPVFPARGQVLFDGKPAAGALVVFHPIEDPAPNVLDPRAVVEDDGTFTLSTHYALDGAPPGKYQVTVHRPGAGGDAPGQPRSSGSGRLPTRYANRQTSGIAAEIRSGANTIPAFRLTR